MTYVQDWLHGYNMVVTTIVIDIIIQSHRPGANITDHPFNCATHSIWDKWNTALQLKISTKRVKTRSIWILADCWIIDHCNSRSRRSTFCRDHPTLSCKLVQPWKSWFASLLCMSVWYKWLCCDGFRCWGLVACLWCSKHNHLFVWCSPPSGVLLVILTQHPWQTLIAGSFFGRRFVGIVEFASVPFSWSVRLPADNCVVSLSPIRLPSNACSANEVDPNSNGSAQLGS